MHIKYTYFYIVPQPSITITAPDIKLEGKPLTLQCEVTTVRGITSRVDIVWSSGGTELERMNDVSSTTIDNSLVYTHSYTISSLGSMNVVVQCEAVINAPDPVMISESVTLNVISKLMCLV